MLRREKCFVGTVTILLIIGYSHSAVLRCFQGSLTNYTEAPLERPLEIIQRSSCIDKAKPSIFYAAGFESRPDNPDITAVLSAYINKGNSNVVLLDWSNEAVSRSSRIVGTMMSYAFSAAPQAERIGIQFGSALLILFDNGLNVQSVHLIGHSLGAHMMGFAGQTTRNRGQLIPRITGLDPAGPLFDRLLSSKGLGPSSALFVEVIHTNPGKYGTTEAIGHVDLWPNCGHMRQPNCPVLNRPFSIEDRCSHDRSWMYYAEAVIDPTAFKAVKATNCMEWRMMRMVSSDTIFLGSATDVTTRGNYYFSTNSQSPFGKGQAGLMP